MNEFDHGSENPFTRLLATLYWMASVVIAIATVLMLVRLIPFYWQRLKTVTDRMERAHMMVSLTGCVMALYGIWLTAAMFLTNAVWRTDFKDWWPTVSWIFMDWNMRHSTSVGFDAMICMFGGMLLVIASNFLGTYDEIGFMPPDWYSRRKMRESLRSQYAQLKEQDPRRLPGFAKLETIDQVHAVHRWENSLQKLEETYAWWARS